MTNVSASDGGLVRGIGRMARLASAAMLAVVLTAACGGGDDEGREAKTDAAAPSKQDQGAAVTPAVKPADPAEARMATAVTDGKASAPIDLLYDIPAKPAVGQPFTVELAVKPRQPGDALDIEVGDSQGITIDGERMARFLAVEAGKAYTFKLQVQGNAPGLYYISVVAKLSSKVQSESRAFSVPVVIGTPVAAEKPTPQKDAGGQPVESMPAKEN